jgi:predicted nucleic acid-binding protein
MRGAFSSRDLPPMHWPRLRTCLGFLRVLPVPVTAIDEVMALLRRRPVTGGQIFDLQIVATMKLNGISRIYTFNTDDFKPFQEIEPLPPP